VISIRKSLGTPTSTAPRGWDGSPWQGERAMNRLRTLYGWARQTARLMIGVPDYENYVRHRRRFIRASRSMTYEEFFFERQSVRYTVSKDRMKGCC